MNLIWNYRFPECFYLHYNTFCVMILSGRNFASTIHPARIGTSLDNITSTYSTINFATTFPHTWWLSLSWWTILSIHLTVFHRFAWSDTFQCSLPISRILSFLLGMPNTYLNLFDIRIVEHITSELIKFCHAYTYLQIMDHSHHCVGWIAVTMIFMVHPLLISQDI